ncbi:hypothetical protein [Nocardia tengchongensis]|uniref:hypothetical protein n=1 Tax=Nocardia tengchongensis TaxID=2055889 RepID=UPI003666C1D9
MNPPGLTQPSDGLAQLRGDLSLPEHRDLHLAIAAADDPVLSQPRNRVGMTTAWRATYIVGVGRRRGAPIGVSSTAAGALVDLRYSLLQILNDPRRIQGTNVDLRISTNALPSSISDTAVA